MLTQCPNCQTTFRVTSEILRVAEGQVRCGRCQTQFDALARLIDEAQPGAEVQTSRFLRPPRPPARHREEPSIEVEEPQEQEDITLEGRHIEISGTYRVTDATDAAGELRQETSEEWVELEDLDSDPADDPDAQTGTFEALSPQMYGLDDAAAGDSFYVADETPPDGIYTNAADSDDAMQDDEYGEEPVIGESLRGDTYADDAFADELLEDAARQRKPGGNSDVRSAIERAAAAAVALRTAAPAADRSRQPIFAGAPRRLVNRGPADDDFDILTPRTSDESIASDAAAMRWKWLAGPLVLLLIVQTVHHYRSDLARHPQIGAPLMSLYGALGLPLTPEWELHAYEIKQWGVLSDPEAPGTLRVRASITNRADFAQPYPLLKLVLEDRWGDQVRAREFEPAEYLDPGTSADRLLAPQQQASAIITIVDPGPDAEGFRFDACLRGRAGPVCAADIPE